MSKITEQDISIILPAKNEASSLESLIARLRELYPAAELLVVDDGSTDDTRCIAQRAGAEVFSHPYPKGNGAAVKSGARHATREYLVFMDADGQHPPKEIAKLLSELSGGYDLVVGARDRPAHPSLPRWLANQFYNRLASTFVGHPIKDLTSGFRACRAAPFKEFLYLLPNGFSYPTTSTMAFFRAGYSVGFTPITVEARTTGSKSHIRILRDGARFLLIIFRIGTLYSPLKLFLPISLFFFLSGLGYYIYTLTTMSRFTNGTALLLITSVLVFLIGLVSEQITHLLYASHRDASRIAARD